HVLVPGLWKHTQAILFRLIVAEFGVKYVSKEHVHHLKHVLKGHYKTGQTPSMPAFISARTTATNRCASIYQVTSNKTCYNSTTHNAKSKTNPCLTL
ncbi:hypothetical protein ACHAW6_005979, partial [Cyclotella cf. meneghiniana]